jgi:tryptophan synthase beta chain
MLNPQILLSVDDLPTHWYNIQADLPKPLPPPKDTDGKRMEFLQKTMIESCLGQEFSKEKYIRIPDEVRELYLHAGRPRPLIRALKLERYLGLNPSSIRLYYKREDLSPTGSHKANTALPQAFYAKKDGNIGLTTETGAGQWGSALAYATRQMDLDLTVFWVGKIFDEKPGRLDYMKNQGAIVHRSPSNITEFGRKTRENFRKLQSTESKDRKHPGSLGIAISEGLEYAEKNEGIKYSLGSVLNHVLMHQSIIGQETIQQLEMIDENPTAIVGCLGGGSNFGGIALPFAGEILRGQRKKEDIEFIPAQSEVAANLKGDFKYDFGDVAEHTPQLKMYTLGHTTEMTPIYGDGLRYHAAAPLISFIMNEKFVNFKPRWYSKDEKSIMEAAKTFLQIEGWVIAPESTYAVRAMIDRALEAKKDGENAVIVANISGHGWLDPAFWAKVLEVKVPRYV